MYIFRCDVCNMEQDFWDTWELDECGVSCNECYRDGCKYCFDGLKLCSECERNRIEDEKERAEHEKQMELEDTDE